MSAPLTDRLAVCSWSLQPATPAVLFAQLEAIGLTRIQCALDPVRDDPTTWGRLAYLSAQHGVSLVAGMFGTLGEDYTTLETIRRTGGLVPDATWDQNWVNIQEAARLADELLGLRLVSFHAGFLPHEESDPDYRKLQQRMRQVAELFAARDITLALETGQETAASLRDFLDQLGCPNVGVNFDPANMILYGKGDPIEALRTLGPWIRQVHLKDAKATATPGTWGSEVVLGTGEVDWPAFFATLDQLGFTGNLCIEREAGNQRVADILTAKELVAEIAQRTA
jgi:sugar phosphate isomerase/epimerase